MTDPGPLALFDQVIEGRAGPSASGRVLESVDPSTGTAWATIPRSGAEDVEAAVAAAHRARPGWRATSAVARAGLLRRLGDAIGERAVELARLETHDCGRLLTETAGGDLPACTLMWHYFAGAADKLAGETVDVGPDSFNFTRREAVGVVAVVIPWNSPLNLFSSKVAAALAAGNTVVVKPAEQASCSVLEVARLFDEVGFPPGVVNVVAGLGEEAGDALVRHPGVARITFTGSTETARRISEAAAGTLKQLAFELGGKSPNVVFADADLDAAVAGASTMGLFTGNAGQTCVAGSRILVEAPVYEEVLARIRKVASQVVLGDPMDPATTMGPIISQEQLDRVARYIELGREEGAELVFGGRSGAGLLPSGSPQAGGYYVEPTLFGKVTPSMRIAREEIFGPVGVVMPFETDDEALALANDSSYGLASGVWTSNLARAHRFVRDLEAGAVWVNSYRRIHWALPFGGVKESGYGRDSGMEGVLENTHLKSAWIELT